jgi:hypothetical protein
VLFFSQPCLQMLTRFMLLSQIMKHIEDNAVVNKLTHGVSIDDSSVHTAHSRMLYACDATCV